MRKTRLPHKHGYPGEQMYYVICDVCGGKYRAKDCVLVQDKFNLQHQMLVCKKDVDLTNPQQYIRAIRERQIDDPRFIRSEAPDVFIRELEAELLLTEAGDTITTEAGDAIEVV